MRSSGIAGGLARMHAHWLGAAVEGMVGYCRGISRGTSGSSGLHSAGSYCSAGDSIIGWDYDLRESIAFIEGGFVCERSMTQVHP